jgi:hypothetical protein
MADRKQKKYIQQFIDGELSPDRKSYVEELLKRDPEAKSYYEVLLKVDEMLKEDAASRESIDMEHVILSQIQQTKQTGIPYPVKKHWTEIIWPSPQWGIGYALVLGILLGVFILSPFLKIRNWKSAPDSELAGSMASLSTAFNLPINLPGITASITAGYASENFLRIEVNVQSDDLTQIRMTYDRDQFSLWTLKAIDQNPECGILADYGSVEVINKGENSYLVLLRKLSGLEENIRIEVFSNNVRQYDNNVIVK